jgi:hypothetical protein
MLGCRRHFHVTTSFLKDCDVRLGDALQLERIVRTFCTPLRSSACSLSTLTATLVPRECPTYTSESAEEEVA